MNMENQIKDTKKNKKYTSLIWLIAIALIAVFLLIFCQLYFGDGVSSKTTFYQNTHKKKQIMYCKQN